jgi:hypothetical protein
METSKHFRNKKPPRTDNVKIELIKQSSPAQSQKLLNLTVCATILTYSKQKL